MSNNVTLVEPLQAPLTGQAKVPGDKSISHRSVLFAAMAEGTSTLSGVLDSADVRSSMGAVSAMGAVVSLEKQQDGSLAGTVTGWGQNGPQQPEQPIDCGNSGTTVRLLMGVIAPWDIQVTLTGDSSLQRRPMKRIYGPLSQMGATFLPEGKDTLPLTERGSRSLAPLVYESPVASAQLKTAIMLAGIFAQGQTKVIEPAPSRDHTERMLPEFGVSTLRQPCVGGVTGPQALHASTVCVPGDPSSAAFPACAAALMPGSDLTICNVSLNPARTGFVNVLAAMGAHISMQQTGQSGEEPIGDIHIAYTSGLHGCEVAARDIASMVDEVPVLALVAANAQGLTVFHDVSELRVKESNRLEAVLEGLKMLGVEAWEQGDDLHIQGKGRVCMPEGLTFDSREDHRLAMTWSVAALTLGTPARIIDFDCVRISYPTFMEDIRRLAR